jgi:N-acyl-D-aspartate/D-glutamate deacylase
MQQEFDVVIRGGLVADGSGQQPRVADVAICGEKVTAVGDVAARGRREVDARGLLVTPGFVDIHTHYDGQVTWEQRMVPSSSHGVTTVVMGNCGVGFAPCRPEQREMLIRLMEGVEDIPHPVLADGLPWLWETYPDYLNFLAARRYDMDVCGYIPHAAVRVYVMGQRGAAREPATPEDLAAMARLVREAMDAGAMGFSTSRTWFHRSSDGHLTPGFSAAEEELLTLARELQASGKGVIELVTDYEGADTFGMLRRLAAASGRPLLFSLLEGDYGPMTMEWRALLEQVTAANAEGVSIKAQVLGRAIGVILGHELTLNPFVAAATYQNLARLPLPERVQRLARPDIRARILAEATAPDPAIALSRLVRNFGSMFLLGDPPDYEQPFSQSIAARAARLCVTPEALAYDLLLERGGRNTLYVTLCNYAGGTLETSLAMMRHPATVLGLGDGGAHCGTICDGSYPTFMLTHWVRDRRGERLSLPAVIKMMSYDTAQAVGLQDRGLLKPGYQADVNVLDFDRLHLHAPETTYDLPGGGRRLVQRAAGYVATMVRGEVVYQDGAATGALPGRLVRGPQRLALR